MRRVAPATLTASTLSLIILPINYREGAAGNYVKEPGKGREGKGERERQERGLEQRKKAAVRIYERERERKKLDE